jgi:HEPN domain-containing protein
LAEYDLETARAMLESRRYLYVGFMCHQTVEKALKVIISRDCQKDEIPPKIHHLLKLADRAGLYNTVPVFTIKCHQNNRHSSRASTL